MQLGGFCSAEREAFGFDVIRDIGSTGYLEAKENGSGVRHG